MDDKKSVVSTMCTQKNYTKTCTALLRGGGAKPDGQVMVELELPSANSKPNKGAVILSVIIMSEYDSSSTST